LPDAANHLIDFHAIGLLDVAIAWPNLPRVKSNLLSDLRLIE
jgi:hypothetical protein